MKKQNNLKMPNNYRFGYTEMMLIRDIENFERKHGAVKFSKQTLKEFGIKKPKFDNTVASIFENGIIKK